MGNAIDHVGSLQLCQQECATRTTEYVREGQAHVSNAFAFDHRDAGQVPPGASSTGVAPGWRPTRKGAGKGSMPGGRPGPGQPPQSSSMGHLDNPIREYVPGNPRTSPRGSQPSTCQGPNWRSREGFVTRQREEDPNASFSPWAPEGPYAKQAQSAMRPTNSSCSSSARRGSKPQPAPARVEDTQIGTGISDFLKRGVAQAAAKKAEAEQRPAMVPSKDGGFITTIQQGFQGIFGHLATSKEEVLKLRGPMIAPEYEAVPGDEIDFRLQYYARQIPQNLGECLKIFRRTKGVYEVSEEVVRMSWQTTLGPPTPQQPQGAMIREVFVFVESDIQNAGGGQVPSEPLPIYLRHCANVAYDLHFGSAMTKVPESSRLSFANEAGTLLKDSDADSKYKAMLLANEQAGKREQAAMEWRKNRDDEATADSPERLSSRNFPEEPGLRAPASPRNAQRRPEGRFDTQDDAERPSRSAQREVEALKDAELQKGASASRDRDQRNSPRAARKEDFRQLPSPPRQRVSMENSGMHVEGGLPPLPPLEPPPLPGPGGSFLLPPGAGLNGLGFLMPPGGGSKSSQSPMGSFFQAPGPGQCGGSRQASCYGAGSSGGSFYGAGFTGAGLTGNTSNAGGSFYNAGMGSASGGSFLTVGGGSFLMDYSSASGSSLPRTGSGVQVGMAPMFQFAR